MTNENSAAIIIDQWTYPHWSVEVGNNIIDFLNNGFVSTAVLASYSTVMSEYNSDNLWYNNQRAMFSDPESVEKIQKTHKHEAGYHPGVYHNCTTLKFLNYHNSNIFQIAMLEDWQLEYYISMNPHIQNLFVFGGGWEDCVKNRSLGYKQLFKMFNQKNINVLTYNGCVGTFGVPVDLTRQPFWKEISPNIYKYTPADI
jgi:hypothetical protein